MNNEELKDENLNNLKITKHNKNKELLALRSKVAEGELEILGGVSVSLGANGTIFIEYEQTANAYSIRLGDLVELTTKIESKERL